MCDIVVDDSQTGIMTGLDAYGNVLIKLSNGVEGQIERKVVRWKQPYIQVKEGDLFYTVVVDPTLENYAGTTSGDVDPLREVILDDGGVENNKKQKNKKFEWTEAPTLLLISLYKEHRKKLNTYRSVNKLYAKIAEVMQMEGYDVKGEQLKNRLSRLTDKLKYVNLHNSKTGNNPITCQYQKELEDLYDEKRNIVPECLSTSSGTTIPRRPLSQLQVSEMQDLYDVGDEAAVDDPQPLPGTSSRSNEHYNEDISDLGLKTPISRKKRIRVSPVGAALQEMSNELQAMRGNSKERQMKQAVIKETLEIWQKDMQSAADFRQKSLEYKERKLKLQEEKLAFMKSLMF